MSIVIDQTYIFWAFTGSVALVCTLLTTLAILVVSGITKRIENCHGELVKDIESRDRRVSEKFIEHERRIERLEDR